MSRITDLFSRKNRRVLNVYCTAGYPQLNSTLEVMKALQDNGADMIELGMPYSDPLADGPVIQASSMKALENGMTIAVLFEQLKSLRSAIRLPVLLMGYMNPVLQYGFERFCIDANDVGIDGVILPDLPLHEYETEYKVIFQKYNLDFIFLITPETSEERIRRIDDASNGFIYAVSSSSITGKDKNLEAQEGYFQRLIKMNLKNKVMIGFGIKDYKTFSEACKHASGAIIGTAFIRAIENSVDIEADIQKFLNSILQPRFIS